MLVLCCDCLAGLNAIQLTFKELHCSCIHRATLSLPILIEAMSALSFQSPTQPTHGVCWPQSTRRGWFRYLPHNMGTNIFSFPVFPSQPYFLYHHCNIKVLVFFDPINKCEAQPQVQFEQEIDSPMHYKTQLNFYFETHLYHGGGGKLKLSPPHNLLSPFGVLESTLGFRSGTFLIFRLHSYRKPLRHPQL